MYREILKPIVRSPELPQILEELHNYWEQEKARREEFYDWVTPAIKAEFIDGEVIVHSPVRSRHNIVLKLILRLVDIYVAKKQLGYVGIEKIMCRFPRNDYEPDLCVFDKATTANITDDQTIFPVPQLIVEVLSPSTEDRDRGVKYKDYQANGVQEYWIVDADTNVLEQYLLVDGLFELQQTLNRSKQVITSTVIEGFSVPVGAFFEEARNLEVLAQL
ncbi:MAG: Uma2 family endonuclease [Bacteroidota bacterium]